MRYITICKNKSCIFSEKFLIAIIGYCLHIQDLIYKNSVSLSDPALSFENYTKLDFDAEQLKTGLNRDWWILWCYFFKEGALLVQYWALPSYSRLGLDIRLQRKVEVAFNIKPNKYDLCEIIYSWIYVWIYEFMNLCNLFVTWILGYLEFFVFWKDCPFRTLTRKLPLGPSGLNWESMHSEHMLEHTPPIWGGVLFAPHLEGLGGRAL